ncbi:unnamed protein product, partial [Urochloa humidicola]
QTLTRAFLLPADLHVAPTPLPRTPLQRPSPPVLLLEEDEGTAPSLPISASKEGGPAGLLPAMRRWMHISLVPVQPLSPSPDDGDGEEPTHPVEPFPCNPIECKTGLSHR